MKRKLIPVVSVVALALGALTAAGASAHKTAHHFGGLFAETVVKGTVTSVDASAGTFTATVDVIQNAEGRGLGLGVGGGRFFHGAGDDGNSQGWGPGFRANDGFRDVGFRAGRFHADQASAPSTVTITTNSSTKFDINGKTTATIANLAAGDRFIATFAPSLKPPTTTTPTTTTPTTTTPTAVGLSHRGGGGVTRRGHHVGFFGPPAVPTTPALEVVAEAPPQLYAFVGTVATAPTALPGSLSVTVSQSLPSGLFTGTQTFQIGSQTLVFGGSLSAFFGLGGATPTISAGDVVAGGEIDMAGLTAAQVEANPLQILVDFTSTTSTPPPTTTTTTPTTTTPTTTSPTTPVTTAMAKRMKTASFKRAIKRLEKNHRKTHAKKHATKHAKQRATKHATKHAKRH